MEHLRNISVAARAAAAQEDTHEQEVQEHINSWAENTSTHQAFEQMPCLVSPFLWMQRCGFAPWGFLPSALLERL